MLGVVVEDLVVDLVGEQQQLVLAGECDQPGEDLRRVHRAGRVVRVDDEKRLGLLGDLGLDVVDVRVPVVRLVAQVVDGRTAGQGRHRRPQRVVGRGNEDFVAVVEQCLHRHGDELGHAVAR